MAIKISGSTIIDDSRQLLNVGVSTFSGNIVPQSDSSTDIGSNTVRFQNAYVDNYYGSGANLTDVGFDPDAQENLYAGTNAGAASDADTCANIALGCNAGCLLNSGDCNIFLGKSAGNGATSGSYNIGIGCCTNGG